jgi:hypothetical protein
MRFLLCGGRLKVQVAELGDGKWEVFVFVGNGSYGVDRVLKKEGFVQLMCEDGKEKVMSKVVIGNVVDYLTKISVEVTKEMKKWVDG